MTSKHDIHYVGYKLVFKANDQDDDGSLTKQELREWMLILVGEDKPSGVSGLK